MGMRLGDWVSMNKRSAGILSSSLARVPFGLAGVPAGVVARNNAERGGKGG